MSKTYWTIVGFVSACAVVVLLTLWLNQLEPAPAAFTSDLIEEVTVTQLQSKMQEGKAKLTLVNFWASWCEPCKVEFPHLLEMRRRHPGLQLILVSVDSPSELSEAHEFLKSQGVDFKTYYKGKQPMSFVAEIYPNWSGAIPASLLLNQDMVIVDSWEGDTDLNEFEERVTRHLK